MEKGSCHKNAMKKTISLIIALVMIACTPLQVYAEETYVESIEESQNNSKEIENSQNAEQVAETNEAGENLNENDIVNNVADENDIVNNDEVQSVEIQPEIELSAEDENGSECTYTLKLVDENLKAYANGITFAVWSEKNGQDDLVWYAGKKVSSDCYTALADVAKNHRTAGVYQLHAYGIKANGKKEFIGETTFEVSEPDMQVDVENYQKDKGTFDVVVRNIKTPAGISQVQVPVWCADGQKDLVWHTATKQSDGSYKVTVSMADHNYLVGNYNIHVYLRTKNGVLKTYVAPTLNVTMPNVEITAEDKAGTEMTYGLKITNAGIVKNVKRIRFAVWSEKNGQDDLVWYEGSEGASGEWTATANIAKNHKTAGKYQVHVYAVTTDGKSHFLGQNAFNVTEPSMSVSVENYQKSKGTFDVVVRNIKTPAGVSQVQVPVWCADGQKDLVWHTATKQSDGSYKVTVSMADHNYLVGNYNIHVYLRTKNGVLKTYVAPTLNVTMPNVEITAEDKAGTEMTYGLKITNAGIVKNVKRIRFAVWSEKNGQDDLVWYEGSKGTSGEWTATANIAKNHKTAGKYQVHVYAVTTDGKSHFLGQNAFSVTEPSMSVSVENYQKNKGTFDVVVRNIKTPAGVSQVQVPVWCADGQKDLVWHTATKQSDGSYKVTVSMADHNYLVGDYNIHVYLRTQNGVLKTYVAPTLNVTMPDLEISAEDKAGTEKNYDLKITNTGIIKNVKRIQFAVWSEKNGQDDLVWYEGSKESSGEWTATANIARNHKTAGGYQVHVYATTADGKRYFLGKNTFDVTEASMSVSVENYQKEKGTFDVVVANIIAPAGIERVRIPVWCADNQSDLKWYDATEEEDGSYRVTVNVANHKYAVGEYKIHIYMTLKNNVLTTMVADNFEFGIEQTPIHYNAEIKCDGKKEGEKRILFIGNSITLHGLKEYWWAERGMASSSSEKDYVHQLVKRVSKNYDVEYNVLNFSEWEKEIKNRSALLNELNQFQESAYDYIIIQLGENVTNTNTYEDDLKELVSYLKNRQSTAENIIVGNFWKDDKVENIKIKIAESTGSKYINLSDIQNSNYQSSIGSFVSGYDGAMMPIDNYFVAIHPNDLGMEKIAEKIYDNLK